MSDAKEPDAEQRVEEIADAYLDQLQRGDAPDRAALLAAHSDIAEALAKQLDFVDLMHRAQQAVASTDTSSAADSVALPEPAPTLAAPPPPDRIGRYHILQALGRGSAGTVYRAYDPKFDRDVALKVLRSDRSLSTEIIQRFEREARIVAQLRHPYIVPFHELGESDGFRYLDMELIDGETLEQRLAAAPLDFRAAADLMRKLAEALDYAHRNGIIHRDVKPSNILLQKGEGRGTRDEDQDSSALAPHPSPLAPPQLTDFGLAHRAAGEVTLTEEGQVLGTLAYMAPEQAQGGAHRVDGRSDVYSLGAVLYRLLTSRVPFPDGDSWTVQLYQIVHMEPPQPRRLNSAVPGDLETICLKCLQKEPGKRYPSAQELADDLGRFLSDEPIRARPVGNLERLWRWSKRKPALAGLLGAVVMTTVGLAVAAVLLLVAYREADRQRDALAKQKEAADKHRALALKIASVMSEKIGKDLRLQQYDLEDLRKLKATVPIYQELLQLQSNDEDTQLELGKAVGRYAIILMGIESETEAIHFFLEALTIFDRLAQAHPDNQEYQRCQGITYLQLGNVYRGLVQWEPAEQAYQKELKTWERLGFAEMQAESYVSLGNVYSDSGHPEQAGQAYQQALAVYRHIAQVSPSQDIRAGLARAYNCLGSSYHEAREPAKAREAYRQALSLRQKLAESQPTDPQHQVNLAITYFNLGNLYREVGPKDQGEAVFQKALEIQKKLVDAHPKVVHYQFELAKTYTRLGFVYQDTDRDRAAAMFRTALDIWNRVAPAHSSVPVIAYGQGECHLGLGQIASAKGDHPAAFTFYQTAIQRLEDAARQDPHDASARDFLNKAREEYAKTVAKLAEKPVLSK